MIYFKKIHWGYFMKQSTITAEKRNYGIDLMRLISMFYVVISHVLGHGNAPNDMIHGSIQSIVCHILYVLSLSAVNIFGLISGYVGYREDERPYRYNSILTLWLQVVFYNVIIALLGEIYNRELVSLRQFLTLFFPILYNHYWYFTAFFALFFFIPFLNSAIRHANKRTLYILCTAIIILFGFVDTGISVFSLRKGFSFLWLMSLYILGAVMKKYRFADKYPTIGLVCGIVLTVLVTALATYTWFEFQFLTLTYDPGSLGYYTFAPTILIAILHVLLFAKISLPNASVKWIRFAAPGAFSVYLINTHFLIWDHIMTDTFRYLSEKPVWHVLAVIVLFSAAFVLICVVIDHIRQQIFRILRIPQACNALATLLNTLVSRFWEN